MKPFDLSKFKKVAEDDKTVTMEHPSGHSMVIALKALPRIQQDQLKRLKLSGGGDVLASGSKGGLSSQGEDVRHAKKDKARGDEMGARKNMHWAKEEAKGRALFEREFVKPKLKGLAEGGDVEQPKDDNAPQDSGNPQAAPTVIVNNQPPAAQQAPQPGVQMPIHEVTPVQAQTAQMPQVKQSPDPLNTSGGISNQASGTLKSIGQGQEAINDQQAIDIAKSKAQVPFAEEAAAREQELANVNAHAYNDISRHADDFRSYIDQHPVDPRHYEESRSTGQKVSNAIGLFLGGLGTPFGGHNYAFDYLNKQIDRDIAAQQQNVNNKNTLFGAYERLYGNSNVATALAKASLNDIYAKKMDVIAAQLKTPQAIQAAKLGRAKLGADSDQLRQSAAALVGADHVNKQNGSSPQGSAQPPVDKEKHPLQGGILAPGADEKYKLLKFNTLYKDKLPAIAAQYDTAVQAEKALPGINKTFMELSNAAEEGGVGGRFHRSVDPHTIAALGGGAGALFGGTLGAGIGALPGGAAGAAIGEGVGHALQGATNTDINRRFDAQKESLVGYLSSALKGTNINDSTIREIVDKNTPEYGDSAKSKAIKLKTIRDFVTEHASTSELKNAGLVK